jgi:hypothetical protein
MPSYVTVQYISYPNDSKKAYDLKHTYLCTTLPFNVLRPVYYLYYLKSV